MEDDKKAREERAKRIHEQIKELGTQPEKRTDKEPNRKGKSESPRDFIHRRMSELGGEEK